MMIYYENILANHNYVAKPDSVWAADITSFDLGKRKIYVFFCIFYVLSFLHIVNFKKYH